ncbi:MAG TPA: SPOR domain-containing protein [Bacteroidia bacterium]|jgi:hypothetical protein|nr:SPOR domain-containing protein [Bacteroidia bacterium]
MKLSKLFIIFLFVPFFMSAQVNDTIKPAPVVVNVIDTSAHIIEAPSVKTTMFKVQEYQRLSHGVFSGYRIQIHFGQDRNAAKQVQSDFSGKFPYFTSYLVYQQPYFKVSVGNYRTKLDAVRCLNQIKKSYPGAFVVKEKINPPYLQ